MAEKLETGERITYVKPEILDLGAVELAFGLDCANGPSADPDCVNGTVAADGCTLGSSAKYPYL